MRIGIEVVGPRASGKTFILSHLEKALREDGVVLASNTLVTVKECDSNGVILERHSFVLNQR